MNRKLLAALVVVALLASACAGTPVDPRSDIHRNATDCLTEVGGGGFIAETMLIVQPEFNRMQQIIATDGVDALDGNLAEMRRIIDERVVRDDGSSFDPARFAGIYVEGETTFEELVFEAKYLPTWSYASSVVKGLDLDPPENRELRYRMRRLADECRRQGIEGFRWFCDQSGNNPETGACVEVAFVEANPEPDLALINDVCAELPFLRVCEPERRAPIGDTLADLIGEANE